MWASLKENVHRIFDRFYRVDKARARQFGGTGLGFGDCKGNDYRHINGQIWATSTEGKRTTIHFTLPFDRTKGMIFIEN